MTDGRPDVVCIALCDVKHRRQCLATIFIKDLKEGSVSSRCFQWPGFATLICVSHPLQILCSYKYIWYNTKLRAGVVGKGSPSTLVWGKKCVCDY